jgi:hypothetical protein
MVGADRRAVAGKNHRHRGVPPQQLVQDALARGVEVLDEHEGHAAVRWHAVEERGEGGKTTRGGTDGDGEDRHRDAVRRRGRGRFRSGRRHVHASCPGRQSQSQECGASSSFARSLGQGLAGAA